MKVIITFAFRCDNLWKSKFVALEKPGTLRIFSPTLWPPCLGVSRHLNVVDKGGKAFFIKRTLNGNVTSSPWWLFVSVHIAKSIAISVLFHLADYVVFLFRFCACCFQLTEIITVSDQVIRMTAWTLYKVLLTCCRCCACEYQLLTCICIQLYFSVKNLAVIVWVSGQQ